MKKIKLLFALWITSITTWACPMCGEAQPRLLRGITHGTGPESKWDYVIVWVTVAIVLFTLYYSVKWIIKPGEKSGSHIKRLILNNE